MPAPAPDFWTLSVKVAQLCPTLCDPMDYTVHGVFQARVLEWVAFCVSRGSSKPRNRTQVLPHCRQILYQLSHQGSPRILEWVAYSFSSGSSRPRNQTPALQADTLPAKSPRNPTRDFIKDTHTQSTHVNLKPVVHSLQGVCGGVGRWDHGRNRSGSSQRQA